MSRKKLTKAAAMMANVKHAAKAMAEGSAPVKPEGLSLAAAMMGSVTSARKTVTSRANGSAPVKPGSRPRGRPVGWRKVKTAIDPVI